MAIIGSIKTPTGNHVGQQKALCCSFVASLLPETGTLEGGGEADHVAPVPFALPPEREKACPEADGTDAALRRFYETLHRTLPGGFFLDENVPCIYDDKGRKVCAPLRVISHARRLDGTGWMLTIEFLDDDLQLRRLSISRDDLHHKPRVLLSQLADRGFRIYCLPEALPVFLQLWDHVPRGWRADHPGWFETPAGALGYLRPDGTWHAPAGAAEKVFLAGAQHNAVSQAGSMDGWKAEIAQRATGNPALIFAISAALAGPLLHLAGIQTAGFNFHGPEASGKSLLLHVAMSCMGHPDRVTPWTAATTGLQRLSAEAQDSLLALDGYPLHPEGQHVRTLLALGNDAGSGKPLSERDPDGSQRWRRVILSSSETPLSHSLQRGKQEPPAPLLRRMIDLPAETEAHGIIKELHGAPDGARFARNMEFALRRHHGHLLPAFLEQLVACLDTHAASLQAELPGLVRKIQDHCMPAAPLSPAVQPAGAERFALVSHAGELAIGFGLLPWKAGAAQDAALQMAALAHHTQPETGWNRPRALAELRRFVDDNAGQIIDLDAEPVPESDAPLVGWQDRDHLYLRSEPIRDEVAELDNLLAAIDDILVPGGEARSRQYRMPATKVANRPRVYRVNRSALE